MPIVTVDPARQGKKASKTVTAASDKVKKSASKLAAAPSTPRVSTKSPRSLSSGGGSTGGGDKVSVTLPSPTKEKGKEKGSADFAKERDHWATRAESAEALLHDLRRDTARETEALQSELRELRQEAFQHSETSKALERRHASERDALLSEREALSRATARLAEVEGVAERARAADEARAAAEGALE